MEELDGLAVFFDGIGNIEFLPGDEGRVFVVLEEQAIVAQGDVALFAQDAVKVDGSVEGTSRHTKGAEGDTEVEGEGGQDERGEEGEAEHHGAEKHSGSGADPDAGDHPGLRGTIPLNNKAF